MKTKSQQQKNRLFRVSFHKYVETMRKLVQELEIKGIFKGSKKKESVSGSKKGTDSADEDANGSIDSAALEKVQAVLKNFEKNFKG